MNCFKELPATLVIVVSSAISLVCDAGAAAVSKSGIDRAAAAIADYTSGKSRRPLFEVEELIRKTRGQAELRQHIERQLVKLLKSDATDEAKLFVCQQLWVIGSDAGVPTLRKMLVDPNTAHMACYALGLNPSPKVGQALRDAMGSARGKALLTIINLLGDRRDRASVAPLSKLAASGDVGVADAAIAALGKISGEKAAKVLAEARKKGKKEIRTAATAAYLHCAAGLAAQGKTQQALAIYRELLAKGEPRLIRRGALIGLMNVGGPEVVPLVLATLRGKDRMMKATAIGHVRTLKGKRVGERFAAELPKLPAHAQVLLIGALIDRRDLAVRPAITAAAKSASPEVRTAAIKALAKIGDASCVGLLARAAAEGTSDEEKRAALVSLRLLRAKGVDAAIIKSMKTSRVGARPQLIQILRDRGAVSAVPQLLEQAAGQDENVRKAAFRALGRLAERQDLAALIKLLVGLEGDGARKEAERAVVSASRKIADEADGADAALAALRAAKRVPARCSLLRVLRGIGNAKALEALRAALKETNPEVQDAAVRALAGWPDARAADALLSIFRTTRNNTHRLVALRGCVRLLGLAGARPRLPKLRQAWQELMENARRPEEKKLVLAGLSNVTHPAALKMVEPWIGDQAVRAEAELAALSIARAIMGSHPEEARTAMNKLLAASRNAGLRTQAQAIVRQIERFEDYITGWQVSGPYQEEGKQYTQLFDIAFPPEKPEARDVQWRVLPAGTNRARPWVLDLQKALGGEQRVAYVRTWVHCEKAQQVRLELGTDDGNKVWLNGRLVHARNVGGAAVPGQSKVGLPLRQGWNALLLKITQATGPWEFCARLRRRDGASLEGIRIDCVHEEGNTNQE